ncbi:hypothetical protein SEPCBS57363_001485 [Sporothrix epigloea]|uniref:Uncharacterized protein n=1 Tax=Sporothrix epigloea TaxID=1892477 RepID=A0ABP0DAJ9_9PEZI
MANPTPSFDELFGDGGVGRFVNVRYQDAPAPGETLLSVPSPEDSLKATAEKLCALAAVVEEGKSLAVYTGVKSALPQDLDSATPNVNAKDTSWPSRTVSQDKISEMDLAEIQTCHEAVAAAMDNINRTMQNKLKVPGYKKRVRVPVSNRYLNGMAAIDAAVNVSGAAGAADGRTNQLAESGPTLEAHAANDRGST